MDLPRTRHMIILPTLGVARSGGIKALLWINVLLTILASYRDNPRLSSYQQILTGAPWDLNVEGPGSIIPIPLKALFCRVKMYC